MLTFSAAAVFHTAAIHRGSECADAQTYTLRFSCIWRQLHESTPQGAKMVCCDIHDRHPRRTAQRGCLAIVQVLSVSLIFLPAVVCAETREIAAPTPRQLLIQRNPETKPFFDRLRQIAGPWSKACGVALLGDDPENALVCAREAMAAGETFWVAIQVQGVDSLLFNGAAREPDGTSWLVTFDSDVHGGASYSIDTETKEVVRRSSSSMKAVPCHELRFSVEKEERIRCGLQGEP
ncbi:MAG: hypothetical protein ABI411_21305 [Tahibacter sp.]